MYVFVAQGYLRMVVQEIGSMFIVFPEYFHFLIKYSDLVSMYR